MPKTLIPNRLNSDVEFARFHNLDIPSLSDTEVTDELNYIEALLWVMEHPWLRQRVALLRDELSRRKWNANEKVTLATQGSKTPVKSPYKGLSSDES